MAIAIRTAMISTTAVPLLWLWSEAFGPVRPACTTQLSQSSLPSTGRNQKRHRPNPAAATATRT
jgi:hypothetical protein